jgi:hypothetical protein
MERDRTLVYLVNDSAWPVTVTCPLRMAGRAQPRGVAGREAGVVSADERGSQWTVQLAAYDLLAVEFSLSDVALGPADVRFGEGADAALDRQVRDFGTRLRKLAEPTPWPALINGGFEELEMGGMRAWQAAKGPGQDVSAIAVQPAAGARCARLRSGGPATYLVSQWYEPPSSGRLEIRCRLRIADAARQPTLRVGVESLWGGQTDYRYGQVGAAPAATTLKDGWAQYIFPFDNLPTGKGARLRVCFDLVSAGEVRVDDVETYDTAFSPGELAELSKILTLSDLHLRDGRLGDCARVLESYWPRYLTAYVPIEEPASPRTAAAPGKSPPVDPAKDETPSGVLDRLRKLRPF